MLGTPAAMAPEQMRGQPVDARTDVYALGLLAYHMLTGAPAFGAPGVVQSYLQIHGPRPRPSSKVDIDPAIDEPIAKALAPDPNNRFPDTMTMLDALRAIIRPQQGGEQDVVALYVEGGPAELASAASIANTAGLVMALTAPDSLIAVAPKRFVNVSSLAAKLGELGAKVALGATTATITGSVVDGPALDVEGWAPYPLDNGIWIAPELK
jgi:serine/threonine-protein kinase